MPSLIIGCGYLGERVAKQLLAHGEPVTGTARSTLRLQHLESLGVQPLAFDSSSLNDSFRFPGCDHAVHCVGYDRRSGIGRAEVVVEGLKHTLARLVGPSLHRLVFISTTSVYAQDGGAWIDESSPAEPRTESGRLALEAEQIARDWCLDQHISLMILRLAGIYGPSRIIGREILRAGGAFGGDPDRWLNLIHVEDAARAVVKALHAAIEGVVLIADGHPITRRAYYEEVARLSGLKAPVFDPALPAEREANRRVDSALMKRLLVPDLLYPDFRVGVPAALGET